MPEEQKEIYYISAPNREACLASPYYEGLKAKNYEALFLFDPWDEFVMDHLREFDGKKLVAAERAEIALEAGEKKLDDTAARLLCNFIKESSRRQVGEVRVSTRLVDSPAVVVESDKGMTSSMRRILKNLNRGHGSPFKQDLEINPNHPMMVGLDGFRQIASGSVQASRRTDLRQRAHRRGPSRGSPSDAQAHQFTSGASGRQVATQVFEPRIMRMKRIRMIVRMRVFDLRASVTVIRGSFDQSSSVENQKQAQDRASVSFPKERIDTNSQGEETNDCHQNKHN